MLDAQPVVFRLGVVAVEDVEKALRTA